MEGDPVEAVGIVLSGKVRIIKEDFNGNVSIIGELLEGDIFGEAMICAGIKHSMVTVQAAQLCEIMFLDYRKIISLCSFACEYHKELIRNMIVLIANKNIMLTQKMEIIVKRTIREKLLSYFEFQSKAAKSRKFSISFNRTELADFIGTDRSSMTRELNNMQRDGLIRFSKNNFELRPNG